MKKALLFEKLVDEKIRCAVCSTRCMIAPGKREISQSPKPNKPVEGVEISPEEHVDRAIQSKCPSISYTYSEPTIFLEYALDTVNYPA